MYQYRNYQNNYNLKFTGMNDNILHVASRGKYPANVLSNFFKSEFKFDGVIIKSLEGFLQSLKTPDPYKQKYICTLIGVDAKRAGQAIQRPDNKFLFWNGQKYDRFSKEYQQLLKKVFQSKFDQDAKFKQALIDSKGQKLIHKRGRKSPQDTILTEEELINLLEFLRKQT